MQDVVVATFVHVSVTEGVRHAGRLAVSLDLDGSKPFRGRLCQNVFTCPRELS